MPLVLCRFWFRVIPLVSYLSYCCAYHIVKRQNSLDRFCNQVTYELTELFFLLLLFIFFFNDSRAVYLNLILTELKHKTTKFITPNFNCLLPSLIISRIQRLPSSDFPPKTIPPSHKMDLDLWDCLGRVKLVL